jgi:hypothetical protein
MDARHFISRVLTGEMTRLGLGQTSMEQFSYLVDAFEREKFVPEHDDFFPMVRELAAKVQRKESD